MNLEGSDEKIRLAKCLANAEWAGAMGTLIDSPHAISVRPAEHSASVTQIESSKLLPWLMLCCLLAGVAVALAVSMTIIYSQNYRELERENRIAQMQLDSMRVAMIAQGLDPNVHLKGEAP